MIMNISDDLMRKINNIKKLSEERLLEGKNSSEKHYIEALIPHFNQFLATALMSGFLLELNPQLIIDMVRAHIDGLELVLQETNKDLRK